MWPCLWSFHRQWYPMRGAASIGAPGDGGLGGRRRRGPCCGSLYEKRTRCAGKFSHVRDSSSRGGGSPWREQVTAMNPYVPRSFHPAAPSGHPTVVTVLLWMVIWAMVRRRPRRTSPRSVDRPWRVETALPTSIEAVGSRAAVRRALRPVAHHCCWLVGTAEATGREARMDVSCYLVPWAKSSLQYYFNQQAIHAHHRRPRHVPQNARATKAKHRWQVRAATASTTKEASHHTRRSGPRPSWSSTSCKTTSLCTHTTATRAPNGGTDAACHRVRRI